MGTPQTPDSIRKSQQDKTPPPKPAPAPTDKLSNPDEGDKAKVRQGGI